MYVYIAKSQMAIYAGHTACQSTRQERDDHSCDVEYV